MKTYGEMEIYLHNSSPRHKMEDSGELHVPAALPPGKSHPYPLDRRLGGILDVVKKKKICLCRNQTRAVQPVDRLYTKFGSTFIRWSDGHVFVTQRSWILFAFRLTI
jgi:hypothetical protein